MNYSDELEHIQPGFAYQDGEAIQLYDPEDPESIEEYSARRCVDYSFDALSVHACPGAYGSNLSVEVRLHGVRIGRCELSPEYRVSMIGGWIDESKTEVTISFQLDPLAVVLEGTLCVPSAGCKRFHGDVPIGR